MFPPIAVGIMFVLMGFAFMIAGKPLLESLFKWLDKIHIKSARGVRKEIATQNKTSKYIGKTLIIHFGNSSAHSATYGPITGWNRWKPVWVITKKTDTKTLKEQSYEMIFYKPSTASIWDNLLGRDDPLIFESSQIKHVDESMVILSGESIEPSICGYPVLTKCDTPTHEIMQTLYYEDSRIILDQIQLNQRKIAEHGLNINPWERAVIEQNAPRMTIPVPQKKQEPQEVKVVQ
jgi:hypothetical protein